MKTFKKLFCVLLSAVLIFSLSVPAFAQDLSLEEELEKAFLSYCSGKVPMHIEDVKEVTINEICESENLIVFTADSWKWADYGRVDVSFLGWEITANHIHAPYDLGIYAYKDKKILTLEEAINEKLLTNLDFLNDFSYIQSVHQDTIKLCEEAFVRYKNVATSDEVWAECSPRRESEGYLFFSGEINRANEAYPGIVVEAMIGNYIYRAGHPMGPETNPTGLYALSEDGTVCPAHELYDKGILTDEEIAKGAGGIYSTELDKYGETEFEEIIIPALEEKYPYIKGRHSGYDELYIHYQKDENTGEKIPVYALIFQWSANDERVQMAHIINDMVFEDYGGTPFTYNYGIYIFGTGEIYDFIEVPELDLEGKANIYKSVNYRYRMGDNNGDYNLTIQDATYMQKCLAHLKDFRDDDDITEYFYKPKERVYISDYNRDGVRNIKDATAIQKRLANIAQ